MYNVSVNICYGAGRDIVATKVVLGNASAYCHGDGRNVPKRFATDVVHVMKIVSVKFGQALDVVAGPGIKEEGVVLLDLCSDTLLNFRMR